MTKEITRRDFLKLSGMTAAALVLNYSKTKASELSTPNELIETGGSIHRAETERNVYAMTIDDGWFPELHEKIMNKFDSAGRIKGTYFLIGNAAIGMGQELVKKTAEKGHEIAYHSMRHQSPDELSVWNAEKWHEDYVNWRILMKSMLGDKLYNRSVKPYARAPYGLFTRGFNQMCSRNKLLPVSWSSTPGLLNRDIPLRNGDILLLHVRYSDIDIVEKIVNGNLTPLQPVSLSNLLSPTRKRESQSLSLVSHKNRNIYPR